LKVIKGQKKGNNFEIMEIHLNQTTLWPCYGFYRYHWGWLRHRCYGHWKEMEQGMKKPKDYVLSISYCGLRAPHC